MINRVFIGFDERQPISYTVLQHSIFTNSSKPISITPLVLSQLPLKIQGLTPFTFSRFLVPYLCNYQGWALFLDIDMLVKGDIAELFNFADDRYAVMVSKNPIRFEWASAILFNCPKCSMLTPQFVEEEKGLHSMNFVSEGEVGSFPSEWNHLVGYDEPRTDAKLIHYTQGIPAHPDIGDCEYSKDWWAVHGVTNSTAPWEYLMGQSVHSALLPSGKRVPKLRVKHTMSAM